MTANNGWPGDPGVPLNPERDGWHWVKHGNGAIVPRFWRCDHWEGVGHSSITPLEPSEAAIAWTYLGPVLTPDEAAALQKRVAELEGALKINFHKHVQGASAADVVITRILPYSVSDVELKKLAGGKDE